MEENSVLYHKKGTRSIVRYHPVEIAILFECDLLDVMVYLSSRLHEINKWMHFSVQDENHTVFFLLEKNLVLLYYLLRENEDS